MKKIYFSGIFFLVCILSQNVYSQNIGNLNGIYYQAVALDEKGKEIVGMDVEGKPLYEKAIGIRFTITKGLNGTIQWEETHTTTTDKYGLFSLTIGLGQLTGNGVYTKLLDIPWIDADQFLKVEISSRNDGNYITVSNQKFMTVPYSFYTDDIADDAITTNKILSETILAEDIGTGSVTSSELLNGTIINEDIADNAVTSAKILDESILANDIDTGSITTSEILNGTIINEDIAGSTIDLSSKVTDTLSVQNGGTGNGSLTGESILVGNGTAPVKAKILTSPDSSILIIQTADSIILKSTFAPTEVNSDPAGTFVINNLPAGSTYTSNAINAFAVAFGDIIIGSIDTDLQGCMLTAYVSNPNVIRISIYNGTGGSVNLGTVNVKVFIVR